MFARSKSWTVLGVLAAALFAASPAEARFGKTSSPRAGSSGSGGRAPSGGYSGYGGGHYYPRYAYPYPYVYPYGWYYGGYGYYAPYPVGGPAYYYPPAQSVTTEAKRDEKPTVFTFGGEGQIRTNGPSFGLNLGLEGERLGFKAGFDWISAFTDDGTPGSDNIYLFNAHLTYALFANEDGRVRLEAGFNSAFAPNLSVLGPSGGLSVNYRIVGPLGLDGAIHFTPFPFTQIDWTAGGAVTLAPAVIRFGWRDVTLDDHGAAEYDGRAHRDHFGGPYIGLAFVY